MGNWTYGLATMALVLLGIRVLHAYFWRRRLSYAEQANQESQQFQDNLYSLICHDLMSPIAKLTSIGDLLQSAAPNHPGLWEPWLYQSTQIQLRIAIALARGILRHQQGDQRPVVMQHLIDQFTYRFLPSLKRLGCFPQLEHSSDDDLRTFPTILNLRVLPVGITAFALIHGHLAGNSRPKIQLALIWGRRGDLELQMTLKTNGVPQNSATRLLPESLKSNLILLLEDLSHLYNARWSEPDPHTLQWTLCLTHGSRKEFAIQ